MNVSMLVLNNFTNDIRVHKEASSLASAGYDVTVVALWQPDLALTEYQNGYKVRRLRLVTRPWKNRQFSPLIKYLEYAWQVWKQAGNESVQIYHAKDASTLPAAWLAARRNHAKIIYDSHELETGRYFSSKKVIGIYRKLWALPERIFIRHADSVITVSPLIAKELTRLYQIPLAHVIYNCPMKSLVPRSDRLRRELNIPENQPILLYQGIVTTGRGIEAFLNAIQLVEKTVGVVLGEGPMLETYRSRVNTGQWKNTFFPGKVSQADLPAYTTSADLGVVLTQDTCLNHQLTLPNKLFEYIHAGLPVICSNLPALSQVVNQYQFGELVDPEDATSIAHGIESILNDPACYSQMKANAIKATDDFNWQNESIKLLKIYKDLIAQ